MSDKRNLRRVLIASTVAAAAGTPAGLAAGAYAIKHFPGLPVGDIAFPDIVSAFFCAAAASSLVGDMAGRAVLAINDFRTAARTATLPAHLLRLSVVTASTLLVGTAGGFGAILSMSAILPMLRTFPEAATGIAEFLIAASSVTIPAVAGFAGGSVGRGIWNAFERVRQAPANG